MMAVRTAPARIPSTGLEKDPISSMNTGSSLRGLMAPDIIFMPVKRMPNPTTTMPICCASFLLKNIIKTMPMNRATSARSLTFRPIRKLVTVVPILAPMMI